MLEWLNKKPGEVFVATYLFKLARGWCSNVRLQLCTRPPRGPTYLVWVGALPHTPSDVPPAPLLPLRHHSTELLGSSRKWGSVWWIHVGSQQQEMGISCMKFGGSVLDESTSFLAASSRCNAAYWD